MNFIFSSTVLLTFLFFTYNVKTAEAKRKNSEQDHSTVQKKRVDSPQILNQETPLLYDKASWQQIINRIEEKIKNCSKWKNLPASKKTVAIDDKVETFCKHLFLHVDCQNPDCFLERFDLDPEDPHTIILKFKNGNYAITKPFPWIVPNMRLPKEELEKYCLHREGENGHTHSNIAKVLWEHENLDNLCLSGESMEGIKTYYSDYFLKAIK